MKINPTMQKECATTATTNSGGTKSHGIARTANYMLQECVRIATSITTTGKNGRKNSRKETTMKPRKMTSENKALRLTILTLITELFL